jgi:ketosteroid isomerase-like protein
MAKSDLELLNEYFEATSKLDVEKAKSLFHKDMVIEAPFTPEAIAATVPKRMEGQAATHGMYDALPQMVLPLNFSNIQIYPLQQEGGFLATYQSDTKMLTTGRPYKQSYISRFQFKDGKIILIAEYYDSCTLVTALGGSVQIG